MDDARRRRIRRWFLILLWTFLGALIVGAFFLMAFFQSLSPIPVGEPGAIILFVSLFTGFILGVLLTDEEIVVAAGAGVLTSAEAVVLIAAFLFSPVFAGIVPADRAFAAFSASQILLSTVLLFPLSVVGSVIGRGIGDSFLPSPRIRQELEALREETRRWHEALAQIERRQEGEPPEDRGKG